MMIRRCSLVMGAMCVLLAGVGVSPARADDRADVKALEQRLVAALSAKDVDRIMACYAPEESLVVFDVIPPRQYVGAKAFRKDTEDFLAGFPGPVKFESSDLAITADGRLAFAHYILHVTGTDRAGKQDEYNLRVTDCLRKTKGKWLIVHEHLSVPVDVTSGKADLLSKP